MGLLKHFRSRSRLRSRSSLSPEPTQYDHSIPLPSHPRRSAHDYTARLPAKVLENIFSYVCPHVRDLFYLPSEESQIGDGCMLCDLRDLSHCARVNRKWYGAAQKLLYESVRIDAVHYCELEELLAEKRRKAAKHFRSKSNVEPVDVPNIRLQLLCKTVREQPALAAQVLFLKLPYMTRETAKGDLARTVSALPNLRYVDLPEGFYAGDPSCLALRQELQARCPDIRKMSYKAGSEDALELLAQRHWQKLEMLELNGLAIEQATLRIVLGSLPTLKELTLSNLPWLDDQIFGGSTQFPHFPSLNALKLINTPNITAHGLRTWVESPQTRENFYSLTLQDTGVTVQDLAMVLWASSSLHHLSITETVHKSLTMASQELPPLTSITLRTLHYEIVSSEDVHGLQKPAESYYRYLASSLHQNALPGLQTLYVRDQSFPDLLLISQIMPPMGKQPSFAPGAGHNGSIGASPGGSLRSKQSNLSTLTNAQQQPLPSGGGFNQTLEVFSKGIDELEWVFTPILPTTSSSRQPSTSTGRPLSAYSASRGLGPQWAQGGFGGEARKSVIVGNGFGGFLAIPQEEAPGGGRPTTSDGTGGTRWGSQESVGSATGREGRASLFGGSRKDSEGGSSVGSFLKPPPSIGSLAEGHRKRASRQDLWR